MSSEQAFSDTGLTISQVCERYGVSTKTVREWIQAGLPVLKAGRRGPNNAALVDGARLSWWKEHRHSETIGKALAESGKPCGGNILRWMCELLHEHQVQVIGMILADEAARLRAAGVPANKAGDLLAELWCGCALAMDVYLREHFEKELRALTETDLDGWASALLRFDFRTTWSPGDQVRMPDELAKLLSQEFRARLSRTGGEAGGD